MVGIQLKKANSKEHVTFRVVDAWTSMSNEFNIFLPDNPCKEVGLAESRFMNGELLKSTLIVIFWFKELLP